MNRARSSIWVSWGLAALSLLLLIPITLLTFEWKTARDPTLPLVYLEDLKAGAMRLTIGTAIALAIWHTLDARFARTRSVLASHGVLWVALGAALLSIEIVRPLPPPLVATIGGTVYKVSRAYSPTLSNRPAIHNGTPRRVLAWKVCKDTYIPCPVSTDGTRNERASISIAEVTDNTPFLGTSLDLAEYGIEQNGSVLTGLDATGSVIDADGAFRVFEVRHPTKGHSLYVTVDPDMNVRRIAMCFGDAGCTMGSATPIGIISYWVKQGTDQSLARRAEDEDNVMAAIGDMAG